MLNRTLELHDVRDIEKLVGSVVKHETLSEKDKEDLIAFLVATAWQLAEKYDPSMGTVTFSTYCTTILKRRVIDGKRKRFGDDRYRKTRPVFTSYDSMSVEVEDPTQCLNDHDGGLSELGDSLSEEATWTLQHLAIPISEGWGVMELAREHGKSAAGVNKRMRELREEVEPCL